MIKLTRDDQTDLVILEKEEVDLLVKGDIVMFPGLVLAYTKDMDFVISKIANLEIDPEKGAKGEQIFNILKEAKDREYVKSSGYASERAVLTMPNPNKGFDS